jgi:hypothetical protein
LKQGTDLDAFALLLQRALIPRAPQRLELGKWTKIDGALNFHVISSVGEIFTDVSALALRFLHLEKHAGAEPGLSESVAMDVSWHRVAGNNYIKSVVALRDSHPVLVLAFLVESTRLLHSWYMKASHDFDGLAKGPRRMTHHFRYAQRTLFAAISMPAVLEHSSLAPVGVDSHAPASI